jgi:hypothetical protein
VPLDNVPEAYAVSILDGTTLVRTLDAAAPAATYEAADQVADFGVLPAGFDFAVAQLSPIYGTGHPAAGSFDG